MKIELNKQILKVETSKIRLFNDYARSVGANIILTLGEPDFPTPDSIKNACIQALNENHTKYGPTAGFLQTRQAVCDFEYRYNQIQYTPEEVIITHGATEGLSAAIFSITNEGDEFIVPIPAYPMYRQIIEFAKGKVVPVDTMNTNFQITKEILESAITSKTKAIIITTPNNPTGSMLNAESLKNVYEVIKDKPIYIILDEVYNQIIYNDKIRGLQQYPELRKQIILCQSLSKPYAMPGWRCGYLIADKDLIPHIMKIHQYMLVGLNSFIQPAMVTALSYNPAEMIVSYKARRDYVYKRLIEMGLEVNLPDGAFYIFPSIKKYNLKSWEFCKRLAIEHKVALIPGECFEADDFIRISYCVDMDTITKALDLLEIFIQSL